MASFQRRRHRLRDLVAADAPDLPLLLDVRLPARRRPDLAVGRRAGPGLPLGCTAGRTTMSGEGLQHEDGHSHLLASVVPTRPRLRPGVRLRDGDDHRARHRGHVRARAPRTASTTSPSTTRTTRCRRSRCRGRRGDQAAAVQPSETGSCVASTALPGPHPRPEPERRRRRSRRSRPAGESGGVGGEAGTAAARPRSCSPGPLAGCDAGTRPARFGLGRVGRGVVGHELQGAARGRARGRALEPAPPGQRRRGCPYVTRALARPRTDRGGDRLHEGGAGPDRPVRARALHSARHRRLRPLGHPRGAAPAFRGRRRAASSSPCSSGIAAAGQAKASEVAAAIEKYGVDPEAPDPRIA